MVSLRTLYYFKLCFSFTGFGYDLTVIKKSRRGGFLELGTLINISSKNKKKRRGKIWEFFLLDILKTTSWIDNLTQRWTKIRAFFSKISALFSIFKKGHVRPLPFPPWVERLKLLFGFTQIQIYKLVEKIKRPALNSLT